MQLIGILWFTLEISDSQLFKMCILETVLTCWLRGNADCPPVWWQSEERLREPSPHYLSIPGLHKPKQPRLDLWKSEWFSKVCTHPCGCWQIWDFCPWCWLLSWLSALWEGCFMSSLSFPHRFMGRSDIFGFFTAMLTYVVAFGIFWGMRRKLHICACQYIFLCEVLKCKWMAVL